MIHGIITYKNNSQGKFSFKNIKSLLEMLEKEDFKEVNIYKDDEEIKEQEIKTLSSKILTIIKKADEQNNAGILKEDVIKQLKEDSAEVEKEIIKLLEQGFIYEPQINYLRYLG